MFRSIRVRMTVAFALLIGVFGWMLALTLAHSFHLQGHFDQEAQRHHIKLVLTTFMLMLFPLTALGAWLIVGRTLGPLRSLSKQADLAHAGRLVSPSSDIEMIELVGTINHLLDRMEATAEAKTQFYAAASHELRTPLHALNGHIETALSKERTADDYRDALVEAQKQTQRLTRLTHDILLLHQLQAQNLGAEERSDVSESVRVALSEMAPLIEARSLVLDTEIAPSVSVAVRQSYCDICVRNLIENAARYATSPGKISVSLNSSSLVVQNDCAIAPGTDLEKWFEPFVSTSGNGLGLAVCRAAAQANGWTVELALVEGQVVATVNF
ncbi:MAG: histidine kinase dimerization/phospho-acceptor domain-containing protein [Armatimonadota bacterium]